MALVVAAGSATLLAVAAVLAPPLFLTHLRRSGAPDLSPALLTHVDRAFTRATLVSLGIGIAVSVLVAGLVTWLITRRLAVPVTELAVATARLADGHYDTAVADPRLGPEFGALAAAVNQLAHRLATTEETRRRLLADLAHELRTPIASLEATVEAVTDGVLPVDATTLDTLAEQAARLHRLVADLEAVSRAEERQLALRPRPTLLADVAARATTALRSRYEARGVGLALEVPGPGPTVDADADRLVEAVTNLLDNALRHTASGGSVTVTVEAVADPRPSAGRAGLARLTVSDNGNGFDPDQAKHLFERFYRADSARASGSDRTTGSGIGLTITRAIVRAHRGSIDAHSRGRGRGATFTVTLPLSTRVA
jgi:signal transduction histidine kinase